MNQKKRKEWVVKEKLRQEVVDDYHRRQVEEAEKIRERRLKKEEKRVAERKRVHERTEAKRKEEEKRLRKEREEEVEKTRDEREREKGRWSPATTRLPDQPTTLAGADNAWKRRPGNGRLAFAVPRRPHPAVRRQLLSC